MDDLHLVCLLLGSNICPEEHLSRAVDWLVERFPIQRISHVWKTPAIGSEGPNFLNVALLLLTPGDEKWMKEQVLRPLEACLGRKRTVDKNAPRTIDIDIITWDGHLVDANLWRYAHVAVPVAELLPDFVHQEACEDLKTVASRLSSQVSIHQRPDVLAKFQGVDWGAKTFLGTTKPGYLAPVIWR